MDLRKTKTAAVAALAILICGGAALAANRAGENWCRVEPGWTSSLKQNVSLNSLLHPREVARTREAPRPRVVSRRPVERVVQVQPRPIARAIARPAPEPTWSMPQKEVAVASCSGGHGSILCPGYQLIGIEY